MRLLCQLTAERPYYEPNTDRRPKMHRFYYPDSLSVSEIELTGEEAQHLTRVLRLSAGDAVEVFDGLGQAAAAEIIATGKRSARLRIVSERPVSPLRRPAITLLTAAPKSERLRWLVEKATELGVDRLTFLQTQNSVVHPGAGKLEKMRAAVIAACKQCGRNDLMPIDPPQDWETAISQVLATTDGLFLAMRDGPPLQSHRLSPEALASVAIAIGPEGGWTAAETADAIDRGAVPLGLGPLTLRIETAALAATSAFRCCLATPP